MNSCVAVSTDPDTIDGEQLLFQVPLRQGLTNPLHSHPLHTETGSIKGTTKPYMDNLSFYLLPNHLFIV